LASDSDRAGFLANAGVDRSGYKPPFEQIQWCTLYRLNQPHLFVEMMGVQAGRLDHVSTADYSGFMHLRWSEGEPDVRFIRDASNMRSPNIANQLSDLVNIFHVG
jgi:hypothetical protein